MTHGIHLPGWIRRLAHDDSGSELVEVALCSAVFFIVFVSLFGFSAALYTEHFVANAAEDGARYAMVRGSSWDGAACANTATLACEASATDVTSYVRNTATPGIRAGNLTVSTTWTALTGSGVLCDSLDGTNSPGCVVRVTVAYPFTFALPVLSPMKLRFSSSASVVITQ
jgi:Flp pilus assembly protein TadG